MQRLSRKVPGNQIEYFRSRLVLAFRFVTFIIILAIFAGHTLSSFTL